MNYWLVKSEFDLYPISKLKKEKHTQWIDVRNYQARNNLRDMKVGEKVLFYHSNATPKVIVGIAEVKKTAYPDPGQFDPDSEYYDPKSNRENPTWVAPDLKFVSEFKVPITTEEMKGIKKLSEMELFKNSRLSVQKVKESEYLEVLRLADK